MSYVCEMDLKYLSTESSKNPKLTRSCKDKVLGGWIHRDNDVLQRADEYAVIMTCFVD